MRRFVSISLIFLMTCSVMGCGKERETIIPPGSFVEQQPVNFSVSKDDGVWRLYKEGKPFYINGAAGVNFTAEVAKYGGNVVRTYSTNESTGAILSTALANGLYVNMGLYMKVSKDFDYSDPANADAIREQFENHRMWVRRFRNHPAILCWSIGNESEAGDAAVNETYFKYVEEIAAMIHKEDPNHPTTVAFSNSDPDKKVKVLKQHAPSVDILSVNMYYPGVGNVAANVATAGWDKPWMITEFGPRGTWNMSASSDPKILPWGTSNGGGLEEMTSTEKAEIYRKIFEEDIKPNESKGCIGSFIFVWGYQTHGAVLPWYGLFDKKGNTFGGVDEISECWTGKKVENPAPRIENRTKMVLNGKTSSEGVTVTVGSTGNTASVEATSPTGEKLTYHWLIYKEGDAMEDGSMPDGIGGLIDDPSKTSITFKAPSEKGGYRLYVFVTDEVNHKVALACIPFLAKE